MSNKRKAAAPLADDGGDSKRARLSANEPFTTPIVTKRTAPRHSATLMPSDAGMWRGDSIDMPLDKIDMDTSSQPTEVSDAALAVKLTTRPSHTSPDSATTYVPHHPFDAQSQTDSEDERRLSAALALIMLSQSSTATPPSTGAIANHDSGDGICSTISATRAINIETVDDANAHHTTSENPFVTSVPSGDEFSWVRDSGLNSNTIISLGLAILMPATTTELITFHRALRSRAAGLGILRDQKGSGSAEKITGNISIPTIKLSLAALTADDPTVKQYQRFRILDLPAELRTKIFEYALDGSDCGVVTVHDQLKLPPLALSCRQLRNEALPIWFYTNTFHFDIKDCNASLLHGFCQIYNYLSSRWASNNSEEAGLKCSMSVWGERAWWSLVEWCKGVYQNEMIPCISDERQDTYEAALCRATEIAQEHREQGKTWKECDDSLNEFWRGLRTTDDAWAKAPSEFPNWFMDPGERDLFEAAGWAVDREDGEWVWPRYWFGEEWEEEMED